MDMQPPKEDAADRQTDRQTDPSVCLSEDAAGDQRGAGEIVLRATAQGAAPSYELHRVLHGGGSMHAARWGN